MSTQERWDQKEVNVLSEKEPRFLRPHNYPPGTPGRPALGVLNLQGRTFMPVLENPFLIGRAEVERLRQVTKVSCCKAREFKSNSLTASFRSLLTFSTFPERRSPSLDHDDRPAKNREWC